MPRVNQGVDVYAEAGRAGAINVRAAVWAINNGACYVITCDGDHRGQPCLTVGGLEIMEGDTWASFDAAVAFAFGHITEHEEREA